MLLHPILYRLHIQNFSGGHKDFASSSWNIKIVPAVQSNVRASINFASMASGAGSTKSASCPDVNLGDFILFSPAGALTGVNLQDILVHAYAIPNNIYVRAQNETGTGGLDPASTTMLFKVIKPADAYSGWA